LFSLFPCTCHSKTQKKFNCFFTDENGLIHFEHEQKSNLLWEAFKNRLGSSYFLGIDFDLSKLLIRNDDLQGLDSPFTKLEIDNIIKSLPSDKSLSTDGFNIGLGVRVYPKFRVGLFGFFIFRVSNNRTRTRT
jgi:hypothetical protein